MPYKTLEKRREQGRRWAKNNPEGRAIIVKRWRERRVLKPSNTCSFPNCGRFIHAHKLCIGHIAQRRKGQELRPIKAYKRFAAPLGLKWGTPEYAQAYQRDYRKDHIAEKNKYIRWWITKNREKVQFHQRNVRHRRRLRIQSSSGISKKEWLQLCEYYGWRCVYCLCDLTYATTTMDHIIPLVKGGDHSVNNLAPACRSCNSKKNVSLWVPSLSRPERTVL